MEFILLFRGGNSHIEQSPSELQAHMQRWMHWMGDLSENKTFISAQPLQSSGRVVKQSNVYISPFSSGSDMVGGYMVCNADSYDAAVEIAKGCPILDFGDGSVEVREVQEIKV